MLYLRFGQQSAHGTPWCQACPRSGNDRAAPSGRAAWKNRVQQLALQREQSYSALDDLDEDYEVGKISERDYQMLHQELLHETAEILNRIETPSEKSLEDEIHEYKERRRFEDQ